MSIAGREFMAVEVFAGSFSSGDEEEVVDEE
jgi:hypothetical protein